MPKPDLNIVYDKHRLREKTPVLSAEQEDTIDPYVA